MTREESAERLTRDDVRDLVRRVVARHLTTPSAADRHPSHVRFALRSGASDGHACLIEPTVTCVGCGYCESFGH